MTDEIRLNPPSTALLGPGGTGKTSALVTVLEAGYNLRMIATEHSSPNRVIQELHRRKLSPKLLDKFEWQFVSPSPTSWDSLKESARIVNTMSLEDISKMRSGIAKSDGTQWIKLLNACSSFKSDKNGTLFGDATEWGDDTMFVIDGLSGVSDMSRNLSVGLKPNPSPGEWGVMQGNILTLVKKLAHDCKCYFTLIAHVEREQDPITGLNNITFSTLGAKLAPKLPPLFTNVVAAQREKATFTWSTALTGMDLKAGDLPIQDGLPPSFAPILASYQLRKQTATPDPEPTEGQKVLAAPIS